MLAKLKKPIDKLIHETTNNYGILFYIPILIIFLVLFIFVYEEYYSSIAILLSVTIIFIQMNYNIYDTKLKKEEELKLRTIEILERKYLNINLFTKEELESLNVFYDEDDTFGLDVFKDENWFNGRRNILLV